MFIFILIFIFFVLILISTRAEEADMRTIISTVLILCIFYSIILLADSSMVVTSHIKAYEEGRIEKITIIQGSDTTYRYQYKWE